MSSTASPLPIDDPIASGGAVPAPSIPAELPVLPLRGTIVLPLALSPLAIVQPRSVKLIDEVMRRDRTLALVAQKNETTESPGPADLYGVATAGVVHQLLRLPDGSLRVVVQGVERIRLGEYRQTEPYLVAAVTVAPDDTAVGPESEGLRRAVVDLFRRLVELSEDLPDELAIMAEGIKEARPLVYLVGATAPLALAARQALLELDPLDAKLRRLVELLQHEVTVREVGRKITEDVETRMTKTNREYYLQEQLKAIQRELGEAAGGGDDTAELKKRIAEAGLPPEAQREADRELARLAIIPTASPEHGLIRSFLDWLAVLPWSRLTGATIDLQRAREVLDQDHFDLEAVKDRILDYLAVRKLRADRAAKLPKGPTPLPATPDAVAVASEPREPILCFVGPPGVGKTSLGLSIARALGRRFVRVSLGGIRDEAEIRGHRRTYIGAMPGRIIQEIKRAEARDPVFILDEIDKVGNDWRGDPSSALLEVLDPAQNQAFVDLYLGVAFDLSQVLFVATANTLDTIPAPLRDRMEVLQIAGYTEEEKLRIAERHLVPRERDAHGLTAGEIEFPAEVLRYVIRGYTREAGVRNLDRQIATLCRKVARHLAEGRPAPGVLTTEKVDVSLGRPRFIEEGPERTDRPGVAMGLAWTPAGGEVLFVEATMMPAAEERLILTGMLGDVMRESAQAALSYVRSDAARLGIDPQVFSGKTIHVHVPAGAIPKDGPSAGVTMVTAIASLASGRKAAGDIAMTGEITLRGKVLPVGGIKEKVLAAHRANLTTVILPRRNERDLEDVPEELRQKLTIVLADTADEVIGRALEPAQGPAAR